MVSARDVFLAQVRTPDLDQTVYQLRQSLTTLKREALQQVDGMDDHGKRLLMPSLYEQVVVNQVQLSGHVGLGAALALAVLDEHNSAASVSKFDRELRDQMTEIGEDLTRRHGSRLAKMVATVEAQRLVWRHSHEFMSWLAFRRGDERYPAKDRLERLDAFGVQPRLLDARSKVVDLLGSRLSAAVEGADRFMLSNRWRLSESPEHALERYVWPLLSYQPASTVRVERARWEYDAVAEGGADPDELETEQTKMAGVLEAQLAEALGELPASGYAGLI